MRLPEYSAPRRDVETMMKALAASLGLCLGFALLASPAVAQQTVKLSTLEWCPYVCPETADGGFNTVVVREAFKAAGYDLQYEVLPWQRAVAEAKDSATVAGYFPEYPGTVESFTLSPPIGEGPLMLIHGTDVTVPDTSMATLKALAPLGVVSGYIQTAAIDAAIADGSLPSEGVATDQLLIKKVAAGRNKIGTMDRYVMAYLLRQEEMAPFRGKVAFLDKPLEVKTLHVAFNNSEYGKKMATVFAEGLNKLDIANLQKQYFSKLDTRLD